MLSKLKNLLFPLGRKWTAVYFSIALLGQIGQPISVFADKTANASEKIESVASLIAENEAKPEIVQETLLTVCESRGYGEDCAKTLLGMLWKESRNVSTAIGDNGKARGYFQIHYKLHKISIECAEDLACSANWTISYLEQNGYPKYPYYAVQCHNGCNIPNGYADAAFYHGRRLWNEKLTVVTAEERRSEIALK